MTEHALIIEIKLFAYIASICNEREAFFARSFIEVFLTQQFSTNTVNSKLNLFDAELSSNKKNINISNFEFDKISNQILNFSHQLNVQLDIKQKYLLLLYLFEFIKIIEHDIHLSKINDCFNDIVTLFNINITEFDDLKCFVLNQLPDISNIKNVLIISGSKFSGKSGIKYAFKKNLKGQISIIKNNSINTYFFKINGNDHLVLNDRHLFQQQIYFFQKGLSIRSEEIEPIYFSDVEQYFSEINPENRIEFFVNSVEYKFNDTITGIHKLSLTAYSGQMNAIVGDSGVGKTTLLNLMNGSLKPNSGQILINNFDINTNKDKIRGLIGFVPQDDLLFEELTVFENLYYNAKLCFGDVDEAGIIEKVEHTLKAFDLFEIRQLKVGNPLYKLISGGQRKRLNIALELIREPAILFVDEPTSGLSSTDSLKMIDLLKTQSLKGKLVFINIHQPSSDIFKYFDNLLLLDKGGYPVYWGNPVESIGYFKRNLNLVDSEQNECLSCGNVNPEELLQLIEHNNIDENGSRKLSPVDWYKLFLSNSKENVAPTKNTITNLVESNVKQPSKFKQFIIYSNRNLLSKLANKQYVIISLLETPLLAIILGFLLRQIDPVTHLYDFSDNENLPSYLFMSVIVAMFIGLIVSAEEIIKDRKILKREAFLNLSYPAYINSKVIFLFLLSILQMLSFVIIGNYILEIKGMVFYYFIILWSTACFANMLGLVISNSLKTVIAIYISIPFILIPQILLAGVVVNFDKLNYFVATQENTPVISDLMATRWSYEALAVVQFKDNDYENLVFDTKTEISECEYQINFLLPNLKLLISDCETFLAEKNNSSEIMNSTENKLLTLKNELSKESQLFSKTEITMFDSLTIKYLTNNKIDVINNIINKRQSLYSKKLYDLQTKKDLIIRNVINSKDKKYIISLKRQYANTKLSDLVLNTTDLTKILYIDNKIIRKYQPAYQLPESKIGRAHLYSATKKIGDFYFDTFWFNIIVLWIMTVVLYFILLKNVFSKIASQFIAIRKIFHTGARL